MKRLIRLILVLILVMNFNLKANAQISVDELDSTTTYRAWVQVSAEEYEGIVDGFSTSSFKLYNTSTENSQTFNYQNIDQLLVREKGKVSRGAWQGALIGASLGALIGWLTYDKEENNWYFGTHGKQIYLTAILGGISFSLVSMSVSSYRMEVHLPSAGTSKDDFSELHYFSRFE